MYTYKCPFVYNLRMMLHILSHKTLVPAVQEAAVLQADALTFAFLN